VAALSEGGVEEAASSSGSALGFRGERPRAARSLALCGGGGNKGGGEPLRLISLCPEEPCRHDIVEGGGCGEQCVSFSLP
jgi:hypothetical protein